MASKQVKKNAAKKPVSKKQAVARKSATKKAVEKRPAATKAAAKQPTAKQAEARPAPSTKPHWAKLGVKAGDTLRVLRAPSDYDVAQLAAPSHQNETKPPAQALGDKDVVLAFASSRQDVVELAGQLAPALGGDPRLWVAYPKGDAHFNRDRGWEPLTALGFEGVALVSLGDRWSAFRLRRSELVKH